jgi:hypothetical protein
MYVAIGHYQKHLLATWKKKEEQNYLKGGIKQLVDLRIG